MTFKMNLFIGEKSKDGGAVAVTFWGETLKVSKAPLGDINLNGPWVGCSLDSNTVQ